MCLQNAGSSDILRSNRGRAPQPEVAESPPAGPAGWKARLSRPGGTAGAGGGARRRAAVTPQGFEHKMSLPAPGWATKTLGRATFCARIAGGRHSRRCRAAAGGSGRLEGPPGKAWRGAAGAGGGARRNPAVTPQGFERKMSLPPPGWASKTLGRATFCARIAGGHHSRRWPSRRRRERPAGRPARQGPAGAAGTVGGAHRKPAVTPQGFERKMSLPPPGWASKTLGRATFCARIAGGRHSQR
jgi:hypothetical protein